VPTTNGFRAGGASVEHQWKPAVATNRNATAATRTRIAQEGAQRNTSQPSATISLRFGSRGSAVDRTPWTTARLSKLATSTTKKARHSPDVLWLRSAEIQTRHGGVPRARRRRARGSSVGRAEAIGTPTGSHSHCRNRRAKRLAKCETAALPDRFAHRQRPLANSKRYSTEDSARSNLRGTRPRGRSARI
jgi:hypothetical protein